MGFWRDLFQRWQTGGPSEPAALSDPELEDRVLSSPSEVEQLEAAGEASQAEDRGLTSPPGEKW